MKRLFSFLASLIGITLLSGQAPVGSWSDHLRYNTAFSIAVTPDIVYASTGSSLIVYDKIYGELKKLSTVNGLSDTGISSIYWSENNKILLIAYSNANIDLILKNSVFNIADILNKLLPVPKRINKIRTSGRNAYLATSFGIVVVDLVKKEIHDTWRPGPDMGYNEVFDIAFGNEKIYAATNQGVWYADMTNQGLAYFGNWNRLSTLPFPDSKYTLALFKGNKLYVNLSQINGNGDSVYQSDDGTALFSFIENIINSSFDEAPDGFSITSPGILRYFISDGSLIRTISSYGWGIPNLSQGIIEKNDIWIADINYGLIKGENMTDFTSLSLPGPLSDNVSNINSKDGKTIICAGGVDNSWTGLSRAFEVSTCENNQFTNFISGTINDAMRSCFDPGKSSHFFISTWSGGLAEFDNNVQIKLYDETNSPLRSLTGGNQGLRICGLAMDSFKNLWITGSGGSGNIKILKPDKSWISYPGTINASVAGDIIALKSGQKWIILPEDNGIYILDDNNTPELFTDDRSKKLIIKDVDENIISSVFSISEDLDGNIWVGTNQGPVIYYSNSPIFEDDVRGYRIKVPRNDGSGLADYMLGTETITAISVDGANRKWLGTLNSGVYLLSADGTNVVKNYNKQNSPVFSNTVTSIAADTKTGEVWIGTSKGTLSVRETATSGNGEFTNVYSFPDPVRENFSGNVTITGLIRDTQIKITDVSGNLVYETVSEGGQASWDLTTYNGRRVTTGVYLVFCSGNDGSKSCITKILVIGK